MINYLGNTIYKNYLKLSKIRGLIFKLRHYVPLSTRKLIYYYMFQSTFLYVSLIEEKHQSHVYINWKFYKINSKEQVFFLPKTTTTNLLYFKFQILKLKDMVKMEIFKFMLRFKIKCSLFLLTITSLI